MCAFRISHSDDNQAYKSILQGKGEEAEERTYVRTLFRILVQGTPQMQKVVLDICCKTMPHTDPRFVTDNVASLLPTYANNQQSIPKGDGKQASLFESSPMVPCAAEEEGERVSEKDGRSAPKKRKLQDEGLLLLVFFSSSPKNLVRFFFVS